MLPTKHNGKHDEEPAVPYKVTMSLRFITASILTSCLLAFTVGRGARIMLMEGPRLALTDDHDSPMRVRPDYHEQLEQRRTLPSPVLQDGKEMPRTIYTAKNFDTASSTASSLLIEKRKVQTAALEDTAWKSCTAEGGSCSRGKEVSSETEPQMDDDEEHLPAGQHLLIDIKNIDSEFLNSEARLAQAMVDVVNDSKLTLLSYHCHALFPSGISCAGVLLESHVAFHTWPEEGVITIDLFTCGSSPLIPVVPIVTRLFGIRSADNPDAPEPTVLWAHKLRGFRNNTGRKTALESADLGTILGMLDFDMKKEVASVQTPFQRIDIYDLLYPSYNNQANYMKSLSNDGSYYANNPELFVPDRQVYLDGVLQSSYFGDAPYHEGIVQPSLITHNNPKRVAIIGGGEGASLREVLKHNSLELVTMIEIDELMVSTSREYLPTWNTCDDIEGSVSSCFDDPRTEMIYEDALAWFIDRFYSGDIDAPEKYDVIIMDALDPSDNIEFTDALYNNDVFMTAIYNALNDDGILAMQLGQAPDSNNPAEESSIDKNRATVIRLMDGVGFQSFHVYEEFHSLFLDPWTNIVICKDIACRKNWYRSVPEIDIAISNQILPSVSGKKLLRYFDGATMSLYQVPHKAFQTVYCRSEPTPKSCEHQDSAKGVNSSQFELKETSTGKGLFTKVNILKGTKIETEILVSTKRKCDDTSNIVPHLVFMGSNPYNPARDREDAVDRGVLGFVSRDIKAGEELVICK